MASLARDARIFVRFARGLKNFLRAPLAFPEAIAMIEAQRRSRESSFLQLVEESIYGYGKSPYRVLLEQAGIEYGDVVELVTREGVEGGLERLYQAGVYITLGEFKGNRPIQRSGFELPVRAEDFDNPLLRRDLELGTSGSRGPARLAAVDFALLRADAACQAVFLRTFALEARPMALWRAAPPGGAGIRHMMIHAKLRRVPERWFSQQPKRSSAGWERCVPGPRQPGWMPAAVPCSASARRRRSAGSIFRRPFFRWGETPTRPHATGWWLRPGRSGRYITR